MPLLTEKIVAEAKPTDRPRVIWDSRVAGFGLRIHKSGLAVFVVAYRAAGRERRATIGRPSELTVKQARKSAADMLADIRLTGSDPLAAREARREALDIDGLLDRFLGEFIPEQVRLGRLAARTAREYNWKARKYVRPRLGKVRVADLTRRDVERSLAGLPPVVRNRVHSFLRRVLNVAEEWELRPRGTNPCLGIVRSRETPRDRILNAAEMAALAQALSGMADRFPSSVAAIRVAAVTGLRIGEVLGMKWNDIDFQSGRVVLPETKTGRRTHDLPAAALQVIAALPRLSVSVFTTDGKAAGVTYRTVRLHFSEAVAEAGLTDVRLHDLRRSFASIAAASGMSAIVLRDLLGWRSVGTAARYVQEYGGIIRDAREKIGAQIAAEMEGKTAEVLSINRRENSR